MQLQRRSEGATSGTQHFVVKIKFDVTGIQTH